MKKLLFLGFFGLFLTVFSLTEAAAQMKTRVRFATGASAANLKSKITGYNYADYVVRARAGQTLSAELTTSNYLLYFVVFDKNMNNMELATGVADWTVELPENGDYTIRVLFPRAEARRKSARSNFALKISIR